MHADSPECCEHMQAARAACMSSEKWLPASQPFCGPRMADMARTVKMQRLPGARMAPPGARAQGAVAGDILWPVRARARVSRSKFRKIRAPQCHFAVKMGTRTVLLIVCAYRLEISQIRDFRHHTEKLPEWSSPRVEIDQNTDLSLLSNTPQI